MSNRPSRVLVEAFVREFHRELEHYSIVFHERIEGAFPDLVEEATVLQENEFKRLDEEFAGNENIGPDDLAEMAFGRGLKFFTATEPIRQGIYNLMIAGLFHLFEQQVFTFLQHAPRLLESGEQATVNIGKNALASLEEWLESINLRPQDLVERDNVDELRLVANVVKHGEGRSEKDLRKRRPEMFRYDELLYGNLKPNIRPMVGEGLRLTATHFAEYARALNAYWTQLIDRVTEGVLKGQIGDARS